MFCIELNDNGLEVYVESDKPFSLRNKRIVKEAKRIARERKIEDRDEKRMKDKHDFCALVAGLRYQGGNIRSTVSFWAKFHRLGKMPGAALLWCKINPEDAERLG